MIYGINYAPELTSIGKYTGEMTEWLAEQGHDVRIITAPPYYPAWRVADGYSCWKYLHERLNGVAGILGKRFGSYDARMNIVN